MFALVNTWKGYHQGKPRVLREAVLVMQLRLLFHFPKGKCDAASLLKSSTPEERFCLCLLCSWRPMAHAVSGGAIGGPVQADTALGNHVSALQTEVSRCSIALHFMLEIETPLGQDEGINLRKAFFPPAEYPFLV